MSAKRQAGIEFTNEGVVQLRCELQLMTKPPAQQTMCALMAAGEIDLVFVGADRVTRNGDLVNKVGC